MRTIKEDQSFASLSSAGSPAATPQRSSRPTPLYQNEEGSESGDSNSSSNNSSQIDHLQENQSEAQQSLLNPTPLANRADDDDEKIHQSLELYSQSLEEAEGSVSSTGHDAGMDRWADDVEKSLHSLGTIGTDVCDNRTTQQPEQYQIKQLAWGHESLPAVMDFDDTLQYSSAHKRSVKFLKGAPNVHAGAMTSPDEFFKDERNHDDSEEEAQYICGCIKREWTSANPAIAFLVILIQAIIVVTFALLFLPGNKNHGVTGVDSDFDNTTATAAPSLAPTPTIIERLPTIQPTAALLPTIETSMPTVFPSQKEVETTLAPFSSTQSPTKNPSAQPTVPSNDSTVSPSISSTKFDSTLEPTNGAVDTLRPSSEESKTDSPTSSRAVTEVPTTLSPTTIQTTTLAPTLLPPTTEPQLPTMQPTASAPSSTQNSLAASTLFQWLPGETRDAITEDDQSPQALAFEWMVQDPNGAQYTQLRALQRFGLATLYYSTGGTTSRRNRRRAAWNNSSSNGWMDYETDECDWHQSTVNSPALYPSPSSICDTTDHAMLVLQLANSQLDGTIPIEIQLMPSLEILDLSQNKDLTGTLPDIIFESCQSLQYVLVFENDLFGTIPTSLVQLKNLLSFHAWDNQFSGPAFPLEDEWVRDEAFQSSSFSSRLLPELKHWHVGNNKLTGSIPTVSSSTNQIRQSQEQNTVSYLESLWLYGNQISGTIPADIGKWSRLTSLLAWSNRLTGTLPSQVGALLRLKQLDLEENYLEGSIPSELGSLSTGLQGLRLSSNFFSGSLPTELSQLESLTVMSLHNNSLTGSLPDYGSLTALYELLLQENEITGSIPSEVGAMRNLRDLKIQSNLLTGSIPSEIGNLVNLESLHLEENQLTSFLPTEIGLLVSLQHLQLFRNELWWTIPTEIGLLSNNLQSIKLFSNNLAGSIPSEIGVLRRLQSLQLHDNPYMFGTLPTEISRLSNLEELAVNGTALTGSIPLAVCGVENLQVDCAVEGDIRSGLCGCDCDCQSE